LEGSEIDAVEQITARDPTGIAVRADNRSVIVDVGSAGARRPGEVKGSVLAVRAAKEAVRPILGVTVEPRRLAQVI